MVDGGLRDGAMRRRLGARGGWVPARGRVRRRLLVETRRWCPIRFKLLYTRGGWAESRLRNEMSASICSGWFDTRQALARVQTGAPRLGLALRRRVQGRSRSWEDSVPRHQPMTAGHRRGSRWGWGVATRPLTFKFRGHKLGRSYFSSPKLRSFFFFLNLSNISGFRTQIWLNDMMVSIVHPHRTVSPVTPDSVCG